jgi:hypothetical protein
MLHDFFHRMVFPALVATVVGSVWVAGWSSTLVSEANKGYWPALPVPRSATTTQPSQQDDTSFQQVLLKHDQVVGVR